MACNMMDEAALEGVQAFIDKRPPRWRKKEWNGEPVKQRRGEIRFNASTI
jgi:hypothetical protein